MTLLFKPYHIEQIRSGSKTVTRREWDTPRVKGGNTYIAATELFTSHEEADCYVKVRQIYSQRLGEMTDEDAREEGNYETVEEFREGYERVYGMGSWDPEKWVYVVEFEYVGTEKS